METRHFWQYQGVVIVRFQQYCKSLGSPKVAAQKLGVSSRTLDRYAKGDFPKPLNLWLRTSVGRKALRKLLADFEHTETPVER